MHVYVTRSWTTFFFICQEAVNKRCTRMDFAVLSWNADAIKVSTLTELLYLRTFLLLFLLAMT